MLLKFTDWLTYGVMKSTPETRLAGMAVSALSLPEAILLRRVMRINLIAVFFAVTVSAIIFIGYLFNFLQNILR